MPRSDETLRAGAGGPDVVGGDEVPLIVFEPLCAIFRRKLKAEGLKYTPERAKLLDIVMGFEGLFQAEKVLEKLRASGVASAEPDARAAAAGGPVSGIGSGVSKATVYRTLRLLQEAGIIQRVPFDDEHTQYQVVYGKTPKDVVIRLDTREMVEVDIPEIAALRDAVCRKLGLAARGHRLQIFAEGV